MAAQNRTTQRSSVSSTEAQNNFGEVLMRVAREGQVFITRYRRPEAVVLSMETYQALLGEEPVDLDALERDYDELIAGMQSAGHRAGVDALFSMTPEELGRGAVEADAAERNY